MGWPSSPYTLDFRRYTHGHHIRNLPRYLAWCHRVARTDGGFAGSEEQGEHVRVENIFWNYGETVSNSGLDGMAFEQLPAVGKHGLG